MPFILYCRALLLLVTRAIMPDADCRYASAIFDTPDADAADSCLRRR